MLCRRSNPRDSKQRELRASQSSSSCMFLHGQANVQQCGATLTETLSSDPAKVCLDLGVKAEDSSKFEHVGITVK